MTADGGVKRAADDDAQHLAVRLADAAHDGRHLSQDGLRCIKKKKQRQNVFRLVCLEGAHRVLFEVSDTNAPFSRHRP